MKKLVLSLLLVCLGTGVYAQNYRNGSSSGLNLRSEPSASASVVTAIPANAKLTVVDKSDSEWYKVRYNGKTGYVAAQYVSEDNQQQQQNAQSRTNDSKQQRNSKSAGQNKSAKSKSAAGNGIGYNTGIGVRFGGWESGLTVKHFISDKAALEGILSTGWLHRGTRITGLYEVQKPLGNNGFYWFWGVGGHLGVYNERYWYKGDCKDGQYEYKGRWYDCDGSRATVGIDGIFGIEYLFREIPITIGVDLKPSIDILGWGNHYGDGAFSVRYVF